MCTSVRKETIVLGFESRAIDPSGPSIPRPLHALRELISRGLYDPGTFDDGHHILLKDLHLMAFRPSKLIRINTQPECGPSYSSQNRPPDESKLGTAAGLTGLNITFLHLWHSLRYCIACSRSRGTNSHVLFPKQLGIPLPRRCAARLNLHVAPTLCRSSGLGVHIYPEPQIL
jgi:hypothetical protein